MTGNDLLHLADEIRKERQMDTTLAYSARCLPFKVKMSCGHVETRMMREATAGVSFDPRAAFQVETDRRRCEQCRTRDGHE